MRKSRNCLLSSTMRSVLSFWVVVFACCVCVFVVCVGCVVVCCCVCVFGRSMVKHVPLPCPSLCAVMFPPCSSMYPFVRCSPIPLPELMCFVCWLLLW